jgi:hypothetical protein
VDEKRVAKNLSRNNTLQFDLGGADPLRRRRPGAPRRGPIASFSLSEMILVQDVIHALVTTIMIDPRRFRDAADE